MTKLEDKKSDIFYQVKVDAIKGGLMAALGAEGWATLCAIAAYMDKDGVCYPNQSLLARDLGLKTAGAAGGRIRKLLNFRWNDDPIILAEKKRAKGQKFANTVYTVLPNSGLSIF